MGLFSKIIEHNLFNNLERGLVSYTGYIDLGSDTNVEVYIRSRKKRGLEKAEEQIIKMIPNFEEIKKSATKDFYESYIIMRDAIKDGEIDLDDEVILPEMKDANDVWEYLKLEDIIIEPNSDYPLRIGFRAPWDIEHDYGILVKDGDFQYCGVSV